MEGKRRWRVGTRLGPYVSVKGSNKAAPVKCAPPALREATIRGRMAVLPAPGQEGNPPIATSDAPIGLPSIGFPSAEVAFSSRDAYGCALVRLACATPSGHRGSRREHAQRAKVGCCACCTSASHVAPLPSCTLRDYDDVQAKGVALWAEFGHWAPPRLAATQYAKTFRFLPQGWDWEADSLSMEVPDPLMRTPLHEGLNLHTSRAKHAFPQSFADQPTGLDSLCGDTQMYVPAVKASPTLDSLHVSKREGATPSEIDSERLVDPTPLNARSHPKELPRWIPL